MTIATAQGRENAAAGYTAQAVLMSLHTAEPGSTGASEVAGGTYARVPVTWTSGTVDGQYTATVPDFNVPAGTIPTWVGLWSSSGTFLDKAAIPGDPPPDFTSGPGTLTVSGITYTQG